MQHLLAPLQAAAKPRSYLPHLSRDVQLLEQYLRAGDARLEPALLQIDERHLRELERIGAAVPRADRWTDADRRLVRFFALRTPILVPRRGVAPSDWSDPGDHLTGRVLETTLKNEGPNDDLFAVWRSELLAHGIAAERITTFVARFGRPLAKDGRLTSAGRFLAALPIDQLVPVLPAIGRHYLPGDFFSLFIAQHADRFAEIVDTLVRKNRMNDLPASAWQTALESNPARFETACVAAFGVMPDVVDQFHLGCQLVKHYPVKYDEPVWQIAPLALENEHDAAARATVARWMIEQRGAKAVAHIQKFIAEWTLPSLTIDFHRLWVVSTSKIAVIEEAAQALGRDARPAVLAGLQPDIAALRQKCIGLLIGFHDPADDEQIESLLVAELSADLPELVVSAVVIAGTWKLERIAPRLWPLLEHKSKPVREAAVPVLAKLASAAFPQAASLLSARKADTRIVAAKLLGAIGSADAIDTLRRALGAEKSENIADAIRAALPVTPNAEADLSMDKGAALREAIRASVKRAAVKSTAQFGWVVPRTLPPLAFLDGTAIDLDTVRYLLFRQSRAKTIAPDVEVRPLYALIDRHTSGDFALAVLRLFLRSRADPGDRWALAVAGLLGDARIVPILTRQIDAWANESRGKLAEYAVDALVLHASDAALLAIDALAIRYRTRFKNIGKRAAEAFAKAAESRGFTKDELGDRVVPWLGFETGQVRVIKCGAMLLEVSVGLDFKINYRDPTKNKRSSSLPASASEETRAEMKVLAAALKDAVKVQLLRLEHLMVQQHRWPADRWRELFLRHPLLVPFSVRLVWGAYHESRAPTSTFRALADRTLTNFAADPVDPPITGTVGIIHPLELDASLRQAWRKHLSDDDIVPPFAQLERLVSVPSAEQSPRKFFHELEGTNVNGLTFRGRAEKRGWARGSVCDGAIVTAYYKPFAAAGVDVFLALDGMYVGIDGDSSITLQRFFFVRHGSVNVGNHACDEPGEEADPRLVVAGEVPPIAFSEALRDLSVIAGKTFEAEA